MQIPDFIDCIYVRLSDFTHQYAVDQNQVLERVTHQYGGMSGCSTATSSFLRGNLG